MGNGSRLTGNDRFKQERLPMIQKPVCTMVFRENRMPDLSLRSGWQRLREKHPSRIRKGDFTKNPQIDCSRASAGRSSNRGFLRLARVLGVWARGGGVIECQATASSSLRSVGTNQYFGKLLPGSSPLVFFIRPGVARGYAGSQKKIPQGLCRCGVERCCAHLSSLVPGQGSAQLSRSVSIVAAIANREPPRHHVRVSGGRS